MHHFPFVFDLVILSILSIFGPDNHSDYILPRADFQDTTTASKKIIASKIAPGYDVENATSCFVNAIKRAQQGDTVVIDCKPGTNGVWNIEGRYPNWFDGRGGVDKVADDITLIFEEGVTLKSIDSTYDHESGLDMLLRLENISGWKISGYGATFEMDKNILPNGEFRNAIALYDCSDIEIEGLKVNGSGGDGIFIGTRTPTGFSKNVRVRNMKFRGHRRQGATITSAENVLFENIEFSSTQGRAPAAGLDIEPDYVGQRLVNIKFKNIKFSKNGYSGILLALSKLNRTSHPIDLFFENVFLMDNWREEVLDPDYKKAAIVAGLGGGGSDAVQGSVTFTGTLIKDEKFDALYTLKHHDSYILRFEDLVIENIGNTAASDARYAIHTSRYDYKSPIPSVGNIFLDGLLVLDDRKIPFWQMEGDSDDGWSIDDFVINDALIVTPVSKGKEITNTTNAIGGPGTSMTYRMTTIMPENVVTVKADTSQIKRGETGSFTISRKSTDTKYPLPIYYRLSGNAENINDYDLLHEYAIIPANKDSIKIPVNTRLKRDEEETLVLTLRNSTSYKLGAITEQKIVILSNDH